MAKHRRIFIFNIRIEESNQIAVKAKGATEPVRTIKKKIFFICVQILKKLYVYEKKKNIR